MLFSRMVASRTPSLDRIRNKVIEMTATGIEALTVPQDRGPNELGVAYEPAKAGTCGGKDGKA